jgi:hypothetical protein
MEDIKKTVTVESDTGRPCVECRELVGDHDGQTPISIGINHYLGHGYRLLHVGSQTGHGDDGPTSRIIAILGKP